MEILKRALPSLLVSTLFISSCENGQTLTKINDTKADKVRLQEGPNTTGSLKEGPNSTGGVLKEGPNSTGGILKEGPGSRGLEEGPNTTGALKRKLTLTYNDNGVENPLTPEKIEYIEIIGKEVTRITASEINISNKIFSTKAEANNKISFDGKGDFVFNNTVDNSLIKFKLKGQKEEATVPAYSNNDERNLRVLIEKDENGNINVSGGIAKADGSIDTSKGVFTISKNADGKVVLEVQKDGKKEIFSIESFENSAKKEETPKAEKTEKIETVDTKKIQDKLTKISSVAGFVGDWEVPLLTRSGFLVLSDKGNGLIGGSLSIDGKTYTAQGSYKNNEENNIIAVEAKSGDSVIKVTLELKGSNKLNIKIVDLNIPSLEPIKGASLPLKRKVD